MEDKRKKTDLQASPPESSWASLALQEATSTPRLAFPPQLFLASPHRPGCPSDWITAHCSLHCHICRLQTEGSVFQLRRGRTRGLWQGRMESGEGENSITNSPRSQDHPSSSSGCQKVTLPTASAIFLKEKETLHAYSPFLIVELKG